MDSQTQYQETSVEIEYLVCVRGETVETFNDLNEARIRYTEERKKDGYYPGKVSIIQKRTRLVTLKLVDHMEMHTSD